jgi:hypothetical protein
LRVRWRPDKSRTIPDRSSRAPVAAALKQAGFPVLLFDYRGYGGNLGDPSEPRLWPMLARLASTSACAAMWITPGWSTLVSRWARLSPWRWRSSSILRPWSCCHPFTSLADVARVHFPFLPYEVPPARAAHKVGRVDVELPRVECTGACG